LNEIAPPRQLNRSTAMLTQPTEPKSKRLTSGWLIGVYFGLALRPATLLFTYLFSGPVAFGVAMFVMQLVAYPLFLRNGPRTSWARNWGFWHFAGLAALSGIVGFFLSGTFFPNP
jgi:hypothetical protein